MPQDQVEAKVNHPQPLGIVLEIEGAEPLKLPVTVKNFTADLVTLEASDYRGEEDGSGLVGQGGSLHLTPASSEGSLSIPGAVAWTRDDGGQGLTLGWKLYRPSPTTRRVLEDHLPHSRRDQKGLWQRWEKAKEEAVRKTGFSPMQHYLAGLGLLVVGLTVQVNAAKAIKLFGGVVAAYGCVVIGSTALCHWWQKMRSLR